MLGKFLEFGIHTHDIIDSLGFYKLLGFRELEVGDTWSHKYAVLTDGDIVIGLHELPPEDGPALTFVHQELAKEVRGMADHGFDLRDLQLDNDVFNQASLDDPDGTVIKMIEARTFSSVDDDVDSALCGRFFELTLPVRDALRGARFWAPLAPEVLRTREEPTTHMRFNAGGLSLGLSESIALQGASLCFRCDERDAIWIALAKHGFAHKEFPGFEGAFMEISAPEGTSLFLFDEDFLGELYEVEESDEPPPTT